MEHKESFFAGAEKHEIDWEKEVRKWRKKAYHFAEMWLEEVMGAPVSDELVDAHIHLVHNHG